MRAPSPEQTVHSPHSNDLTILFENEDFLVINKPSGVPSLPKNKLDQSDSVATRLLLKRPELSFVNPAASWEAGALHRLDNQTSGCLVFAKNQTVFKFFSSIWNSSKITKLYRALIFGKISLPLPALIETPIAHHPRSKKRMVVLTQNKIKFRGKPLTAKTEILEAHSNNPDFSDLTLRLYTGVRHQIRVHLASLGYSILGDSLYGNPSEEARFYLHAWKIILPIQGGAQEILAPLPKDWQKIGI